MRPRTVQAWFPESPPGPNREPAICARPRLSYVAVTSRGYPDVNSGRCWGRGLSGPRDRFHLAATDLDRRGSVAVFLTCLSRESKTKCSLKLHLHQRNCGAPGDTPSLQNRGTR